MRVLGVDPGLTRCGVGVVEGTPGGALTLVAVDVVRTDADDDIGTRLVALERGIERWLDETRPDAVAVERVFSQHNVRTVMGTAQAGAVAITCAARRGLPVALHTPSEAKAAVTGNGRADKAQVTTMVTRLLRLPAPPRPADAADALALAICHLWRGAAQTKLAGAARVARQAVARRQQAAQKQAVKQTAALRQAAARQQAAQRQAAQRQAAQRQAAQGQTAQGQAAVPQRAASPRQTRGGTGQ